MDLLRGLGEILSISSAWESEAIGSNGPNFLNACVLFRTETPPDRLKDQIIRPVEAALGRVRTADKYAPRTIDIDVMMIDGEPTNLERWNHPYVVLPMAELAPDLPHPLTHENLSSAAQTYRERIWIVPRPDIPIPKPDA